MITSRLVALVVALAAVGCQVTKQEWVDKLEPAVVDKFCDPNWMYRQCFSIDETRCRTVAKKVVHECIVKLESQLPDTLDETSGKQWGEQIGGCAGGAFAEAAGSAKVGNPKCLDAHAWSN